MLDLCLFVYSVADNGNSAGQVKLTIGYSADESRLFIIVHSCRFYTILITFYQMSPSEQLVAEKNGMSVHLQNPGSLLQGRCWPIHFFCPAAWQEGHNQETNCHQEEGPQPRVQWEVRQMAKNNGGTTRSDICILSLSLCRFDFDFTLEESMQKRLDLSVKHSGSFMSREKEVIGKVLLSSSQSELQFGITLGSFYFYQHDYFCFPPSVTGGFGPTWSQGWCHTMVKKGDVLLII